MHRTLVALCVCLISLCCHNVDLKGQSVRLTELIPWPLLAASIPVGEVRLTNWPTEQIHGWQEIVDSSSSIVQFGLIPVGTAPDPGISFALMLSDPPQLFVDTDNDEILSSDELIAHREQISGRSYSWFFRAFGEYEDTNAVISAETALAVTALYSYETGGFTVGYSGFAQRKGHIEIDDELVPIALTTALTDATYTTESLYVGIDIDGNGFIDSLPGSHELFLPGEKLQVGMTEYEITHVSPWGDSLRIESIGTAPEREIIAVGEPAPRFDFTTVTGKESSLESFLGKVVILLFLPSLSDVDCASCLSADPYYEKLISIHQIAKSLVEVEMLVVVASDEAATIDLSALPTARIHYIADAAIADTYRRNYATIVIDPEGTIAAQDDVWTDFKCERPQGHFDELNISELGAVVERLIADMVRNTKSDP